jgi:phage shock protein C
MSQNPYGTGPQDPGQVPPPYQGPKRLVRLQNDKMLGGVCSGVAWYLGADPTLIRVLAVVAGLFTFPVGPLIYVIMWAIVPKA